MSDPDYEFVAKYSQLPPESGITFEGFEDIKIPSRSKVKENLNLFLRKEGRTSSAMIIIGEWGEGKTDAYQRYIKPTVDEMGDVALFVSATTILNSYKIKDVKSIVDKTPLESIKFLTVLFYSIKNETKDKRIPNLNDYYDAEKYVYESLSSLIGPNKKKVYVFIDEFEEFLYEVEILRRVISGIKEILNGQYKPLHERGEYEGCFHIIMAVTPEAYNRIINQKDLEMTIGGFTRRIEVIELPKITTNEGIDFLLALTKYSYKGRLPSKMPFKNLGVLRTICKVARNNPGAMVTLFSKVLKMAASDNALKVINGPLLIEFLTKIKEISIYGASTSCINSDYLERCIKLLKENDKELGPYCGFLLKILCGELKPFSIEEIKERISYSYPLILINKINDVLRRKERISRAILKVAKLKSGKTLDDLIDEFKKRNFLKWDDTRGERVIKIGNYSESLTTFKERVTYTNFDGVESSREVYLPYEDRDIESFFYGIDDEGRDALKYLLKKMCDSKSHFYIASEELLIQLYPPPIPPELGFIKDKEERLHLWRDVTRNFDQYYEGYISDAFIELLKSARFDVLLHKTLADINYPKYIEIKDDEGRKLSSMVYPVSGNVTHEDIAKIYNYYKNYNLHLVFLIFMGKITEDAREEIDIKKLGEDGNNVIEEYNIHPSIIKRILCTYLAKLKRLEVDEIYLKTTVTNIARDLDIEEKYKKWLLKQYDKGIAIKDIKLRETSNYKDLPGALRFFLNFVDEDLKIDETFQRNQELLDLTMYGKKVGIIPDIAKNQFKNISLDLVANDFLSKEYKVKTHPVEERIIKILKNKKELTLSDLEKYFVIKEDVPYLKYVFLPILEYKGYIEVKGNSVRYLNMDDLERDFEKLYEEFSRCINHSSVKNGYYVIYVIKKRGERLITAEKYKTIIEKLYQKINRADYEEESIKRQYISLMRILITQFKNYFEELVIKAYKKSREIYEEIESLYTDINYIREGLEEGLKDVGIELKIEEIKEMERFEDTYRKCIECKKLSSKEIEKKVNELDKAHFFMDNDPEDAHYYNPKYFFIDNLYEEMKKVANKIKSSIEESDKLIRKIRNLDSKVEEELKNFTLNISKRFSRVLVNLYKSILKGVSESPPIHSFSDLEKTLATYVEDTENIQEKKIDPIVRMLKNLQEKENKTLEICKKIPDLGSKIQELFDEGEYYSNTVQMLKELDNLPSVYNQLLEESEGLSIRNFDELKQEISNYDSELESVISKYKEIIEEAKDLWENYKKDLRKHIAVIDRLRRMKLYDLFNEEEKQKLEEIYKWLSNCLVDFEVALVAIKISYVNKRKREFLDLYNELLKRNYPEEHRVLKVIIERYEMRKKIELDELRSIILEDLRMPDAELNRILSKLREDGIIKFYVEPQFVK
ncbi:MAG: hypothetical protein ACTSR0_01635 [Candidatus Asgardarchaeia archaeon]